MREATEATARKRTVREIEGIVDVTTVTTAVTTDGATGTATAATVVKTVAGTTVETTVETTAGIETGTATTATTGGKNGSEEAGKTALSVHLAAFVKFLSVICNSSVSSACFLRSFRVSDLKRFASGILFFIL